MSYVQVKQKFQVTIPVAIRQLIDLHEGDTLEVNTENGKIILSPKVMTDKPVRATTSSSIASLIGANKGSGLYASAEDIDNEITNQRNEWN